MKLSGSDELSQGEEAPSGIGKRKWIGIYFKCCRIYYRLYKNEEGTAYEGFCPGCRRKAVVKIGPEGTDSRFFQAE